MRIRRLIACALTGLSFAVAAGCSEEETPKVEKDSAAEEETNALETETTEAKPETAGTVRKKPKVAKPAGPAPKQLVTKDLIKGKGSAVAAGDELQVNYVGVLFKNGEQFDSSFDAGQPFEFELGAGVVIPGWDRGLEGMRVGGRRQLTIPPDLAYGADGSPPKIGPNEPLVFVIDLLGKR